MPATNQKYAAPFAQGDLPLCVAVFLFLIGLSVTSGCAKESAGGLKQEDAQRIKGQKVTAEKLSPAQMQAAREEIGAKLSKSNVPSDVPQLNPASAGKPK